MADGIYIGMAGATARMAQLDSIADNLANARTPGFKASRPAFETFLAASGAEGQAFPVAVATGFDMRAGPSEQTGNPLSVLPEGQGFLAVRTPSGTAYTRDGRLSVDADGQLRAAGSLVLDSAGGSISVPQGATPTISPDGVVHAAGQEVGRLALYELSGPLDRVGPSLLAPAQGGGAVEVEPRVRIGEIEASNSTPLEAAVQMVNAQRHYETSMQAIQTYRQLDQRSTEIGRIR